MSARAIQEQLAISREISAAETPHRPAKSVGETAIHCTDTGPRCILEPPVDDFSDNIDTSSLPLLGGDAEELLRVLRQLELMAKLRPARIALKVKGNILFWHLADIASIEAEGNYVSLRHRTHPCLVHESLSSMADKLKPYGFIRIHRSVVVNGSDVEEIQPLPTGEYRLRVKGGKEYVVSRTYKHNLRDLAQLWVGTTCPEKRSG